MKKTNLTFVTLTIFFATSLLSSYSYAENYTTKEGFEKIKTNLDNSISNKSEYEKNLNVVDNNLVEIGKSKNLISKQKDEVTAEIISNNESLKKIVIQEKDLNKLIADENEKLNVENKQLQDLEKMIAVIKSNQKKRGENIADYQNQLKSTQEAKLAWKNREAELRSQEGKVIQSLRGVASEETTWSNKKKGYEIEVKRWQNESEKQKKIYETYQALKEK